MSNYEFYAQSLDDAVLTYSATEDTNFPVTNIQDRNIQTFFKDTNAGANSVNIEIDLGASRTCDYIFLGNYIANTVDGNERAEMDLERSATGAFGGEETVVFADELIDSDSLTDFLKTFSSAGNRYWRIIFHSDDPGNLDDLQFGTIFLGTLWNWAHEPELRTPEESGYPVTGNQAGGGSRFSQIANTTVRRKWNIPLKFIIESEKVKHETFRDQIFIDEGGGFSRYPFYFTDDGGTTFFFARYRGRLRLNQHAYQAWETVHPFEEEL